MLKLPWNFPKLKEGDHVLICKHVYENDYRGRLHWDKGGEFTRDDGTKGTCVAFLFCDPDRRRDPRSVDFIEYFWAKDKFHCCDTHKGIPA